MTTLTRRVYSCALVDAFHEFDEVTEVMLGVVRAGRGFRMVLNGKDRQDFVPHAFDAVVV